MVNDVYGHEAGDAMLVAIGQRLAGFVDGLDDSDRNLAARLGGDEFALLLTGLAERRPLPTKPPRTCRACCLSRFTSTVMR